MDQPLSGGAGQKDKMQWTETEAQEVPPEHGKELLYCAGDRTPEQLAREFLKWP